MDSNAPSPTAPGPAPERTVSASLAPLAERLRAAIPPKRFAHSLGVAAEARRLAVRWGEDPDRAERAGLLHDCAKGVPKEEQAATCDRLGVPLDEDTRACPATIHGLLGAFLARTVYGETDEGILRAIRLHTVGAPGMTRLDKIIFLADSTEPGRSFDGVDRLRAETDRDLDDAMRFAVQRQVGDLLARGRTIHPAVLRLWNDLVRSSHPPTTQPPNHPTTQPPNHPTT